MKHMHLKGTMYEIYHSEHDDQWRYTLGTIATQEAGDGEAWLVISGQIALWRGPLLLAAAYTTAANTRQALVETRVNARSSAALPGAGA